MKKQVVTILSVLTAMVIALSLAACANGGTTPPAADAPAATGDAAAAPAADTAPAADPDADRDEMVLRIAIEQDIETLDPQQNTAAFTTSVGEGIHEALLRLHNGVIQPGMASEFHTDDYQTWTFTIRDNAQWSDGVPITAHDFEFAYKEIFHRPEASKVYIMFNGVRNFAAIMEALDNEVSDDELRQVTQTLGVTAVDDRTLVVELERADSAFIEMFSHPAWSPLRRDLYEAHGANLGSSAESTASNGPFQIREWRLGEAVILERNPNYWDADSINLDVVEIQIVRDVEPRVNLFREGRIHSARATGEHFEVMPDYVHSIEGSGWNYILVNMHRRNADGELVNEEISNLLSNRNFISAISNSIDREALYTRTITNPAVRPTNMVIPDGINSNNSARQTIGQLRSGVTSSHRMNANPELAREYLQLAMDELGISDVSEIPEIRIIAASVAEPIIIVEFISHSVAQTLGISIVPEPIEFGMRDARIISGDYDLLFMGWGSSRNDPISYLNVWAQNLFATGWPEAFADQHAEYSDLIARIDATENVDERARLMLEAEEFVLQHGPFIPLSFTGDTILRSPNARNFHLRPFGALYDYVFAYVVD